MLNKSKSTFYEHFGKLGYTNRFFESDRNELMEKNSNGENGINS